MTTQRRRKQKQKERKQRLDGPGTQKTRFLVKNVGGTSNERPLRKLVQFHLSTALETKIKTYLTQGQVPFPYPITSSTDRHGGQPRQQKTAEEEETESNDTRWILETCSVAGRGQVNEGLRGFWEARFINPAPQRRCSRKNSDPSLGLVAMAGFFPGVC